MQSNHHEDTGDESSSTSIAGKIYCDRPPSPFESYQRINDWMVPTKLTSRFRGSELAVLVAITSHAERSGYFEQSKSDLAINAGVTKSTVCEATKGLLRLKVIVCERKGSGHTRTLYRLNVPHVSECDQEMGALNWRSASGHIFDSLDLLPARSVTPPEPSGPEGRPTAPSRSSDQRASHEVSGEQDFRGEPPRTSAVRQVGHPVSGRADPSGPAARTAPQSPRALGLLPNTKNNSSSQQSGIAAAAAVVVASHQETRPIDEREQRVREILGNEGIGGSTLERLSRSQVLTPEHAERLVGVWKSFRGKGTGALVRDVESFVKAKTSKLQRVAEMQRARAAPVAEDRVSKPSQDRSTQILYSMSRAELVTLAEGALPFARDYERRHIAQSGAMANPIEDVLLRAIMSEHLEAIERGERPALPAVKSARGAAMG